MNEKQCTALTNKGPQCSRTALDNCAYCNQHVDKRAGVVASAPNLPTESEASKALEQWSNDMAQAIEKRKTSQKARWRFAQTMDDISSAYAEAYDAHGQKYNPPTEQSALEWVSWFQAVRTDNKGLLKALTTIDQRAYHALFLETFGMVPDHAGECRKVLASLTGDSAYKRLRSIAVNYSELCAMVANGELPPRIYQTASKWVTEHIGAFVIGKRLDGASFDSDNTALERTRLQEWVGLNAAKIYKATTNKDGEHTVTKNALDREFGFQFTLDDSQEETVKDASKDQRAMIWAKRVAHGSGSLASVPSDIAGLAGPMIDQLLSDKGIRVVSGGSELTPILAVLNTTSASLPMYELAFEAISAISARLKTRYDALLNKQFDAEQKALDERKALLERSKDNEKTPVVA